MPRGVVVVHAPQRLPGRDARDDFSARCRVLGQDGSEAGKAAQRVDGGEPGPFRLDNLA